MYLEVSETTIDSTNCFHAKNREIMDEMNEIA